MLNFVVTFDYRVVKRGVPKGGGSLIFPKVPQSSLGILRVPQLPPPLGSTPGPLGTLQFECVKHDPEVEKCIFEV